MGGVGSGSMKKHKELEARLELMEQAQEQANDKRFSRRGVEKMEKVVPWRYRNRKIR